MDVSRTSTLALAVLFVLAVGAASCSAGQGSTSGGDSGDSTGGSGDAVSTGSDGEQTDDTGREGGDSDTSQQGCSTKWDDPDGDGVGCKFDNCRSKSNPDQKDQDGDTWGDPCDNCPEIPNVDQTDSNGDGKGDACTDEYENVEVGDGDGSDSDGDGLSKSDEEETETDPSNADSDGDGLLDGTEVVIGSNPNTSDQACASVQKEAKTVQKPIDIVFVIDNSGSMDEEIAEVERRINDDFANIIQMSGVDYRVIMISARGSSGNAVCIESPLGGGCGDTSRFKHLDEPVYSHDSLNRLFGTFSQWRQWLRDDAFVVFVEITDDRPQDYQPGESAGRPKAEAFEQELFSTSSTYFGSKSDRNYIFHSIISVEAKGNNQAYQPSEPVNDTECSSSADTAPTYEWISKLSGGLRYPVCKTNSYDAVFNDIADGVVDQAKIGCAVDLPSLPSGKYLDRDGVALQFRSNQGGSAEILTLVSDQSNCADGKFYLDGDEVKLCPATCNRVSSSKNGQLRVLVGCQNCETIEPEKCDGEDNDCDGEVDEGCPSCKLPGSSCEMDGECCNGNCRTESDTCGPPCRPIGISCQEGSQCCTESCSSAGRCIGG